MNVAILTFSFVGAITGTASLLIMAKVAKEMNDTKTKIEDDLSSFKEKTGRNLARIRTMMSQMEL